MGTQSIKFNPSLQTAVMRRLEKDFITDLSFKKRHCGKHEWNFRIDAAGLINQGKIIEADFSEYKLRLIYTREAPPKIFVLNPSLPKDIPHRYEDKSLCLYKPGNWNWENQMDFGIELFPRVFMWLYHYEKWQKHKKWFGAEATHNLKDSQLQELLKLILANISIRLRFLRFI